MSIDYGLFKFAKNTPKKTRKESVSKKTYQEVFEACKGMCVLCGTPYNLQLHHINGRGKGLTNNPLNCVMLCEDCHLEVVHGNQKKYRPILNSLRKKL